MARLARHLGPVIICAALIAACDDKAAQETAAPPPPPAVGVVEVSPQEVAQNFEFVGRVVAIDKVDLRARVEGFLQKRLFTEGAAVKAGELLFSIEKDQFQAAADQATADLSAANAMLTNAQVQYQRAATLVRSQNIPQATVDQRKAELDTASAKVQQAEAALREAQINLGYTDILAPVAGVIGQANVTEGNLVGPSSGVLATIVSIDPIYVTFPVAQRQLVQAQEHAAGDSSNIKVRIRLPDGSIHAELGKIDFIDNQVDQSTDSVTVRAVVPNPKGILKDGQIARPIVEMAEPEPQITVPMAALVIDQAGSSVMVVDGQSKVEQRRVTLGPQQGVSVVVSNGLEAGERVIVDGLQKVRPGQVVQASATKVTGS
ncbi:MAG TPA: efflux RND transporter periplasmic adaptor subunit [Geminicoccaceae bacterium]|nr:efflux RND transporter periplasmic adaptor subunit [Geminicoccus sp.]HMU50699.1 efflux RND transporter periplasmic adaptor subunit [Geminicoccaceae bacterium]